jgi:molybdopterin-guanine dinucleotide biosynthesis protein A
VRSAPDARAPVRVPPSGRTGVVVCGGASRRMGRDKATIDLAGRTLLERAVAALTPSVDAVLLATGAEPRYAQLGLGCVLDRAPGAGPLAGLEAALAAALAADSAARAPAVGARVAVLAVDMPGVDSALVAALCERAERDDADALLLATESGVEPLCGVYHVRVLPAVRAALDAGERRMTAFTAHPLADGRRPRIETLDPRALGAAHATLNVNDPRDLAAARGHLATEARA